MRDDYINQTKVSIKNAGNNTIVLSHEQESQSEAVRRSRDDVDSQYTGRDGYLNQNSAKHLDVQSDNHQLLGKRKREETLLRGDLQAIMNEDAQSEDPNIVVNSYGLKFDKTAFVRQNFQRLRNDDLKVGDELLFGDVTFYKTFVQKVIDSGHLTDK